MTNHIALSEIQDTIDGYLTCALWSSHDNADEFGGEPMDANYSLSDIADDSVESMAADCNDFVVANLADIDFVFDNYGDDYNLEYVGHDFWLTRNGHGTGFWDRYYGDDSELSAAFDRLSEAAKAYGESDLYVGDDGSLYIS